MYKNKLQNLLDLANQGDITSQKLLALIYEHGLGTTQNYHLAANWYEAAANQGYSNTKQLVCQL